MILMNAAFRSALRTTVALALAVAATIAAAQDLIVKKQVFTMPSYTTAGGQTIKAVRIGYQTAGQLNAARDNAILVCHFFSGTSHAFGKYSAEDKAAGYWDAIIGPGKAIDTNRYFVVSSDTLVNLNSKAPNVITTGPASVNRTGKPWGTSFGREHPRLRQRPEARYDRWVEVPPSRRLDGASVGRGCRASRRRRARSG
jgi:homoserine O-acetyltransferase